MTMSISPAMWIVLAQESPRIGSPFLSIVVPAAVFLVSFLVTWLLYRHFSRQ